MYPPRKQVLKKKKKIFKLLNSCRNIWFIHKFISNNFTDSKRFQKLEVPERQTPYFRGSTVQTNTHIQVYQCFANMKLQHNYWNAIINYMSTTLSNKILIIFRCGLVCDFLVTFHLLNSQRLSIANARINKVKLMQIEDGIITQSIRPTGERRKFMWLCVRVTNASMNMLECIERKSILAASSENKTPNSRPFVQNSFTPFSHQTVGFHVKFLVLDKKKIRWNVDIEN